MHAHSSHHCRLNHNKSLQHLNQHDVHHHLCCNTQLWNVSLIIVRKKQEDTFNVQTFHALDVPWGKKA
jgi:hypothetical protein